MRVSNVLFHAALPFTLLSVKVFGLKGYRSMFDATEAWIIRKATGKVVAQGVSPLITDLYRLVLWNETIPSGTTTSAYHTTPVSD